MNYYNEHEPKAAAWLRELIDNGHIPPGHVDSRDIQLVQPDDLVGFTQCHFFAGIAGWPLALKLAGWPSDRPVWTGSCPCQPFSVAGKGRGKEDARHLWPQFRRLIRQCRPPVVFGEQVASAAGRVWLSGVCSDLEALGYCTAGADLCAAGGPEDCEIGIVRGDSPLEWERATLSAPHIRQRLFWVAGRMALTGPQSARRELRRPGKGAGESRQRTPDQLGGSGGIGGLGDASFNGCEVRTPLHRELRGEGFGEGRESGDSNERLALPNRGECPRLPDGEGCQCHGTQAGRQQGDRELEPCGESCGLEHPESHGWLERRTESGGRGAERGCGAGWANFELVPCRDGKARRIESGSQPLAHGVPGRVGLLRGYGNAIVPRRAAEFIQSAAEALEEIGL